MNAPLKIIFKSNQTLCLRIYSKSSSTHSWKESLLRFFWICHKHSKPPFTSNRWNWYCVYSSTSLGIQIHFHFRTFTRHAIRNPLVVFRMRRNGTIQRKQSDKISLFYIYYTMRTGFCQQSVRNCFIWQKFAVFCRILSIFYYKTPFINILFFK